MRVLLTGANGFIGSWVAKRLLARGVPLRIFATKADRGPLTAIAGEAAAMAAWFVGDVSRREDMENAARGCDAIIHIAAMLGPACAADPRRCLAVNLGGTLNVFEVAKQQGIRRVIYTTSAAVFGPTDGANPCPQIHYGAFKLAEEGCARAYWLADALPSIGFRPFVVYGPGRKHGLSAGPSLACRAAALGERYIIPFTGRTNFVYVDDVASAYEEALFASPNGAEVYNLAGDAVRVADFIAEINRILPGADIGEEGRPIPITAELAPDGLATRLPNVQRTALSEGIAATLRYYQNDGRTAP